MFLLAFGLAAFGTGSARAEASVSDSVILGDYGAALPAAGGGVDIASTVDRLAQAHVSTYAYVL